MDTLRMYGGWWVYPSAWSISMTPMTPIPRQYYSKCYMRALALSYNE